MAGENLNNNPVPAENTEWDKLVEGSGDDLAYAIKLYQMEHRSEEPEDFEGEKNLNSRTGKTRTESDFDLYPRMKGETNAEYGARLRRMHELTKKYLEEHPLEDDKKSEPEEPIEPKEEMSEEEWREILRGEDDDIFIEQLTEEEKRKHEEEFKAEHEEEFKAEHEDEAKTESEEETGANHETEEQVKTETEQKAVSEMSDEEIDEELASLEEEIAKLKSKLTLVAINADFTHDKKELAHDLAEQDLNAEVSKSGFFKRLWKGSLFKKYYEKKYEKEYLEGSRDRDGETVHDLVEKRSRAAMERFVLGAVEDGRFIHEESGEKLVEADAETTAKIRDAIETFARAELKEGETEEDLAREFREELGRVGASARDQGENVQDGMINNYLDVALQAREAASHHIAIDQMMENFKVYNAEVRDGLRTEVHRDAVDKIIDKLEGSKIGVIIPAQVIAGAAGIAAAFTQTGVRAIAGAAGGLAASSILSGLKERNRITEDRARMLRDAANGLEYASDKKSREKYETRIGGTLYDLKGASELTMGLEQALALEEGSEGRDEAILSAITEARVRIDFSDSSQKDLIAYSSEDRRGEERLALDKILIRAEKSLSSADVEKLEGLKTHLQSEIEASVDKDDRDFNKLKNALALKKAGKTFLFGAATIVASQEIIAAFDPGKISLLEKAGLVFKENTEDASETLLAGAASRLGDYGERLATTIRGPIEVSAGDTARMAELEAAGYTRTEISAGTTTFETNLEPVDPASSTAALRVEYDGWANNGTLASDGNELAAHFENGQFVSSMSGTSTFGSEVLNIEELAGNGDIKGYLTVDGAKFEIASSLNADGQLTWGENGIFTTTTGETIHAIGDNGEKLYKYFEIAVDRGVDADGIQHIVPLATDVGADGAATMFQEVSIPTETPAIYEYVKTTTTVAGFRDLDFSGVFAPETARVGLGETRPSAFREIETNRESLGEEGVRILTDTNPFNEANAGRYSSWWDTLTDENKEYVRDLVERLNTRGSNIPFGRAFRDWYNGLNNPNRAA